MQQYFQISKSLQGLQIIDMPNPAPAIRSHFSKAVLMVFVRFSKVGVGTIWAYGRNTLTYSALSSRRAWCSHFFQRKINVSPHFFQRISGVRALLSFAGCVMSEKRNRHHKAVLDSKDIEAIKAEQKTLKEDYEQHLSSHKETLKKLLESETSILSNHRDDLKEIMRGESVWLSFKAWVWAIIVFELLLVVVGVVVYYWTRAKCT